MTVVANCTSDLPNSVVRNSKIPCHAVFAQLFFALAITLLVSPAPAAAPATQRTIRIVRTGTASQARFLVAGLTTMQLKALRALEWDRDAWNKLFAVYVVSKTGKAVPAIYGDYTVSSDQLLFEPAFPLKPGLTYRATFLPAVLPTVFPGRTKRVQVFSLPGPSSKPTTTVSQIYPSGNLLPENQLKFYIHFSQPMSRGEAYKNIRLLDTNGKQVPFPFLELAEELWDPQGKRFTLLFDPGRIKRGLKPREEVGPALLSGGNYTLVIDRAWRDSSGKPLKKTYRKRFQVADPDDTQPNPKKWKITAPAATTNQPLLVLFTEPLDHAMLQRVIGVVAPSGEAVNGTITVDQQESRWKFEPTTPWLPGEYQLLVSSDLEDRAGNSIGRPFEVDVFRQVQPKITRKTIQLPIRIAP
jgi:hypothetical protein